MVNETLEPYSLLSKSVQVGAKYIHYKKLYYKILAVARHSETLEEVVVYQALYGDADVWVRPLAMFLDQVEVQGKMCPRFALCSP